MECILNSEVSLNNCFLLLLAFLYWNQFLDHQAGALLLILLTVQKLKMLKFPRTEVDESESFC